MGGIIAIVDYGMGNLGSVKRKLDLIGVRSIITDSPLNINKAEKIILPGVGHFAKAVAQLKKRGLWEVLTYEVINCKKPVLGICLGMQLMAKNSEEGNVEGLGWFDANVIKFRMQDKLRNKVPHTGWNSVIVKKESALFYNLKLKSGFYFIHSYHLKCMDNNDILSETFYEYDFVSSIQKENLYGVQFHPEKSHDEGEQLLRNFIRL
jgi:imidazole glycerol-phosphate synthase subunit HisH